MSNKKTVQLWEYKFERMYSRLHATNASNGLGQGGWEMVSVLQRRSDKENNEMTVVFKRQIAPGAVPEGTKGLTVDRLAKPNPQSE